MNHEDVYRMLKTFPAPKPTAEAIYADVVLAKTFLTEVAHGFCYNHGRHNFTPVSDVKKIAEDLIGRTIDDVAFMIAVRMAGLRVKQNRTDKSVLVKLPPLDRFEEVRDLWNEHQRREEKQIDEEIKRWAEFRAKYPNYRPA